jgi:hypothetical protein
MFRDFFGENSWHVLDQSVGVIIMKVIFFLFVNATFILCHLLYARDISSPMLELERTLAQRSIFGSLNL